MTTQNTYQTHRYHLGSAVALLFILATSLFASEEGSVELEPFIVGATRTERLSDTLGVSADLLPGKVIDDAQYRDIRDAFLNLAGVYPQSDTALASTGEIMIRGNSGSRVLSLVDGVKTNTSIFSQGRFMAGASGFNLDRVEVVRGPQSTLYGSSAIGGVILLETRRGRGAPRFAITAETGSYNSALGAIQGQGEWKDVDFSFHVASQESDNDRVDNEGKMRSYSFRFDYDLAEGTTLGIASRGEFTDYSNPGGDLTPPPSERIQSDTVALSAYVETVREPWTQKFTLSLLDEYYRQTGFLYIGDASNLAVDWENEIEISNSVRLVAGANWEQQEGNDNSFPESDGENWALFAQAEIEASENAHLVVGARRDDYELAGSKTTWRANGAWRLPNNLKLRAAVGTAFRAPNFFNLFSTSSFALGNPGLKPESSEGWEIGFDQYAFKGDIQMGITYFRNDIENLVVWTPTTGWDGTYTNRDVAENYGVEAYVNLKVRDGWHSEFTYTWTESFATNLELGGRSRVPGPPRHQFSWMNNLRVGEKWTLGASANYVVGRESFGSVDIDNYLLVRAWARFQFSEALAFTGRIENALDEDYTISFSSFTGRVPAQGQRAFAGLQYQF